MEAPPRKLSREHNACWSAMRNDLSSGVSRNRASARASYTTPTHTHGREKLRKRKKTQDKPLGVCAYLSRVSGLESAPDEYRGERDDVPRFRLDSRSRGFERKKCDGHETGQETPYRQRPYCLCGIDVSPEIPSLSEKNDPPVVVFQHEFAILTLRVDVRDPVCAA